MEHQSPGTTPPVRVVVRLPYNRPEVSLPDPPMVEWNTEKENVLWEVIARSRAADTAGTDWKGLAAHLEVPLPYLLFRAQARYEEDLRGLQGIRSGVNGSLMPTSPTATADGTQQRPPMPRKHSDALTGTLRLRDMAKSNGSSATRGRVPSFSNTSLGGLRKIATSSTITLRGPHLGRTVAALDPPSPTSESDSDTDDDARKIEEAEKEQEAQAELAQKLKALELALTADNLGLVRTPAPRSGGSSMSGASASASGSGHMNGSHDHQRTRSLSGSTRQRLAQSLHMAPLSLNPLREHGLQTPSSRSASVSSANSPQGSIPSIPSPPPESLASSQGHHTRSRRNTYSHNSHHQQKSTSPPAVSPRLAKGQMRYQSLAGGAGMSEQESAHGSSASSFSDISDMSLSSSALESGVMSNIRGSRVPTTGRSRLPGRGVRGS